MNKYEINITVPSSSPYIVYLSESSNIYIVGDVNVRYLRKTKISPPFPGCYYVNTDEKYIEFNEAQAGKTYKVSYKTIETAAVAGLWEASGDDIYNTNSGSVLVQNRLGIGQLDQSNSGDYLVVEDGIVKYKTATKVYSAEWNWNWKFNWTFDNSGGCNLTKTVAGNYDHDPLTVFFDGGVYKVRIESPLLGGGNVQLVRGVWLSNAAFDWDGFWAEPFGGTSPTNYYSSFINYNNYTDIILTEDPGDTVQVYYIYIDGTSKQYDGLNNYPTVQKWNTDDTYAIYNATDKFHEFITSLWRAGQDNGNDYSALRNLIWSSFKEYLTPRSGSLVLDNFNRKKWNQGQAGIYINSSLGQQEPFTNFGIETVDSKRCLAFKVDLPNSDDSAWYGYYLRIEDVTQDPYSSLSRFSFSFKGTDQGLRVSFQVNNAKHSDADRFINNDYIFIHNVPDWIVDWTSINVDLCNLWKKENIIHDGDRVYNTTWWSSGDVSPTIEDTKDVDEILTYENEIFYTHKKISWTDSGGDYFLWGVGNNAPPPSAESSSEYNLNFLMKQNVTELKDIEIQVHQDGTTYTYTLKADDQKEDWHRYTIPFLLFDPSPVLANLPITWIQWKYADSPNDGEIYLTDIKFGSHKSYENLKENLLLCQFYTEQQGISEQAFYISNIYFDIEVENDYPYVPTFGCSEYDFGIGYWRGPALVHYTCPLAPYVCNDNEVLDTYIEFINDAQNEYYSTYGGKKGPVIPIHTLNHLECIPLLGSENFNRFCWWDDYPELGYGYGQYWSFWKAAEYYYFTNDSNIKDYLDNWIDWFEHYIIIDTETPSGYLVPTDFEAGVISYGEYNPYIIAAVTEGLIYYYWSTGDSRCATWIRNFLDDLRINRFDSTTGYTGEGRSQAHGNSKILKIFGMVVAGRYSGYGNYDFVSVADDVTHFDTLASWILNNKGNTKPNVLNSDRIPYAHYDNEDSWSHAPHYIYPKEMGTTESVVTMIAAAVEYGRVKGDYSWFDDMVQFIIRTSTSYSSKVSVDDVTIEYDSINRLAVKDDGITNAKINTNAAIDASKIANGTVSNTEFQYINSVTSNVQDQLDEISENLAASAAYLQDKIDSIATSGSLVDNVTIEYNINSELRVKDDGITNAKINTNAAIDASKISSGVVSNTEFDYLNGLTGNIQDQLDSISIDLSTHVDDITIEYISDKLRVKDDGITNAKINTNAAIDASKIANGTVSNTEFQYINSVTSNVQDQLDAKVAKAGDTMTGGLSLDYSGLATLTIKGTGDTYSYSTLQLWSNQATDKYWGFVNRKYSDYPDGLVIEYFNGSSYTQELVIESNGDVNVLAGDVILNGSNTVTGLRAATSSGEAVRYDEFAGGSSVDPGHRHSKLYDINGNTVALSADNSGNITACNILYIEDNIYLHENDPIINTNTIYCSGGDLYWQDINISAIIFPFSMRDKSDGSFNIRTIPFYKYNGQYSPISLTKENNLVFYSYNGSLHYLNLVSYF